MSYSISQVWPTDMRGLVQIDTLLECEGIRRDKNLDYICAMYDDDYRVIATGSCFGNTLRCAHLPNVVLHDSGTLYYQQCHISQLFFERRGCCD